MLIMILGGGEWDIEQGVCKGKGTRLAREESSSLQAL